jgi:hypothetical protein
MSELTEENFLEFIDRIAIHQQLLGSKIIKLNKKNIKWFKRFIGASFNISYMPMRKWFSQKFKDKEKYGYKSMAK